MNLSTTYPACPGTCGAALQGEVQRPLARQLYGMGSRVGPCTLAKGRLASPTLAASTLELRPHALGCAHYPDHDVASTCPDGGDVPFEGAGAEGPQLAGAALRGSGTRVGPGSAAGGSSAEAGPCGTGALCPPAKRMPEAASELSPGARPDGRGGAHTRPAKPSSGPGRRPRRWRKV